MRSKIYFQSGTELSDSDNLRVLKTAYFKLKIQNWLQLNYFHTKLGCSRSRKLAFYLPSRVDLILAYIRVCLRSLN